MNCFANRVPERIAIDGPSASGKSTVGAILAKRLGYDFLDTGLMYRAVTYLVHRNGVCMNEEGALGRIAQEANFEVRKRVDESWQLLIDGCDATDALYSDVINRNVSIVSAIVEVRDALVQKQREIASRAPIVMVGRDIGTVVLSSAPLKIFLTASPATRAARRLQDATGNVDGRKYEDILQSIERRDDLDSNRSVSPLRPAVDAITIATDDLTVVAVVDKIEAITQNCEPDASERVSDVERKE